MPHIHKAGDNLTEAEWDEIRVALKGSRCENVFELLYSNGNTPQPAHTVLPIDIANQGTEQVNLMLRKRGVRVRLVRIGPWRGTQDRLMRPLAFIRWPRS